MLLKEKCAWCQQGGRSGECGFREIGGERVLREWEETVLPTTFCPHAICEQGRGAIRTVLEGGRHPHQTLDWEGKKYLWFTFTGKAIPFMVDPESGRVYQPWGEELVPVGVVVGKE